MGLGGPVSSTWQVLTSKPLVCYGLVSSIQPCILQAVADGYEGNSGSGPLVARECGSGWWKGLGRL